MAVTCVALLARLPTPWAALGAVCFAVCGAHDSAAAFLRPTSGRCAQLASEALAVPIWWVYAMARLLISAGFFFGRATDQRASARPWMPLAEVRVTGTSWAQAWGFKPGVSRSRFRRG